MFRYKKAFQIADQHIIGKQQKDVSRTTSRPVHWVRYLRTEGLSLYQWPVLEKKTSKVVEEIPLYKQ